MCVVEGLLLVRDPVVVPVPAETRERLRDDPGRAKETLSDRTKKFISSRGSAETAIPQVSRRCGPRSERSSPVSQISPAPPTMSSGRLSISKLSAHLRDVDGQVITQCLDPIIPASSP